MNIEMVDIDIELVDIGQIVGVDTGQMVEVDNFHGMLVQIDQWLVAGGHWAWRQFVMLLDLNDVLVQVVSLNVNDVERML